MDDTNEQRMTGWLWDQRSGGDGLFAMVNTLSDERDMRTRIPDKARMEG